MKQNIKQQQQQKQMLLLITIRYMCDKLWKYILAPINKTL